MQKKNNPILQNRRYKNQNISKKKVINSTNIKLVYSELH